jgi:ATP-dependent protease ClpP protease subunit
LDRPAADDTLGAGLAWRFTMPSIPYVLEKHGSEERVFDIYSRLMKDRIIFMLGEVDDVLAKMSAEKKA